MCRIACPADLRSLTMFKSFLSGIYIYVLKKYFPEVSEAARGLRSSPRSQKLPEAEGRGTLLRLRENIFSTDRPKR